MIRLLLFKLGSNPETQPIVRSLRKQLGDCFIAGVEESRHAQASAFDEILTSHEDGMFGGFSRLDLDGLAMTSDLYEEIRSFEGQGLRMIERLNYYPQENYLMPEHTPQFGDSFQARSDLFFRYCLFWSEILHVYKFDAVISQNIAHSAWDLPLEKLCEKRGIPHLIFSDVGQWPRVQFIQESVEGIGNLSLGLRLKQLCAPRWMPETPDRVVQHLSRLTKSKPIDDPLFNKLLPREGEKFRTGVTSAFLNRGDVRSEIESTSDFFRVLYKKIRRLLMEPKDVLTGLPLLLSRVRRTRKSMKDELMVCQDLSFSMPFVFFPLHFQPEASTSARGRHFVEQREAIALVARSLPSDWRLVVKEHPHQYRRLYARTNYFWQRVSKIPRVVIVRHDLDSQEILKNSEGIVSISNSSIASEAWALGKRVVILGDSHFREAPGVTTTNSLEGLQRCWDSPPPKTSESQIYDYLRRVEDATVEGTLYGSAWYLPKQKQHELNSRMQNNVTEIILAWLSVKGLCDYPLA